MSNLGVPCSSQFFLSLLHPAHQNPANSVCMTAFPVFPHCYLSSKLSVILHLGYCSIISLASAAVVWPALYLFGILPLKSFVASHLTGNQPTFELRLCHLRHMLHEHLYYLFSSSETLFKMLGFFMPTKTWLWLTYLYEKITPHCFLLLLCLPYLYLSIVLFVSLTIFIAELFTSLKQVFVYSLWVLLRD